MAHPDVAADGNSVTVITMSCHHGRYEIYLLPGVAASLSDPIILRRAFLRAVAPDIVELHSNVKFV